MTNDNIKTNVSITLSGKEAEKEIKRLKDLAEELRKKLQEAKQALNPDTKEIARLERELKDVNKTLDTVTKETKKYEDVLKNLSGSTIKQLRQAQRQLATEIQKLKPNTEEYINATKKYAIVTQRLKSLEKGYKNVGFNISNATQLAQNWTVIITGVYSVLSKLSGWLRQSAEAAAKLDDTYSDVMKTTGLLKDEVAELDEELMKIDTRTSREQLLNLARDAGKLGITGKENILGFVRAADQIQVALGEDLGEGAIKNLGKIADVLGYTQSMGIEDALLSIGSAINAVGQASTASESYMVDFVQCLAGVGAQTGISAANLIGFASGLDQSTMKVEMAATAFQTFIMKLYEEPAKFAEYANMEIQEFTDLLNNDANNAVITILQSLNQQDGFASLVPMFQDMGLDGARAVSVLAAMATNISAVTDAQSLANVEFEKGTSVQTEYETKNNNLQASLEKSRKEFENAKIALGQGLTPIVLKSANALTVLATSVIKYGKELLISAAAVVALTAAFKAKVIWMKVVATWNATLRSGALLLAAAKALLTGNLVRAKIAWAALNTVMKLSVFGAVTAAVTALVVGISKLVKKKREAKQATDDLKESTDKLAELEKKATERYDNEAAKIKALTSIIENNNISIDERRKALAKLKEIVPDYHADLTEEGVLINNNKAALDNYIVSLREKARLEVFGEEITALEKQKLEQERIIAENRKIIEELDEEYSFSNPYHRPEIVDFDDWSKKQNQYNESSEAIRTAIEEMSRLKTELDKLYSELETETQKKTSGGFKDTSIPYEDAVKNLEKQHELELNALKELFVNKEITEEEYIKQSNEKQLNYLQDKVDLAKQYGQDETKILSAHLDEQIRQMKAAGKETAKVVEETNNEEAAEKQKHLEDLKRLAERFKKELLSPVDLYNEEKSKLDELRKQNLITEEEYQNFLLELKKKYADQSVRNIDSNNNLGIWEKYQLEKEALQQFFEEGEMGWQEYEKSVKDLRLKYTKQTIEAISSTLNQVGNFISSMRDFEMAQAEAQYQADLTAAGDNAEKREQIQEEYEAKKLEIQKKYADADMAINIAKAIAAGALAIMQALAQAGPLGYAMAGIIGATTALEVATIVEQRNAIMNTSVSSGGGGSNPTLSGSRVPTPDGFSDGGFTPTDDDDNTPVGIVHANEWVAPSWMIKKNPVMFARLEQYRQSGHRPEVISGGYRDGGYTASPSITAQQPDFSNVAKSLDRLNRIMEKIDKDGIQSYMVYNQYRDFNEQRNRFKKITSK